MQQSWFVRSMRRIDALFVLAMVAMSVWVAMQGGQPWNSFSDGVFCGLAAVTACLGLRAAAPPWLRRFALACALAVTVFTIVDGVALLVSPDVQAQIVSRSGMIFVVLAGVLGPFNAFALRRAGPRMAAGVGHADAAAAVIPEATPAATSEAISAVPSRRGNYFLRHWRGQLPLWLAFWINGVLFGLLFLFAHGYLALSMKGHSSLQLLSLESVAALVLAFLGLMWWAVGLWRCADVRLAHGRARKRSVMVQIMLVCLAWVTLEVATTAPLGPIKDLAMLAIGKDVLGGDIDVKVAPDGRSVILVGFLHQGAADRVRQALDAAPQAKTLVLSSPGGRLQEGELLANLVRTRQLDTYVDEYCASACTYAFLAGHERAATPQARIGFHRPYSPFGGKTIDVIAGEDMMERYREAGLPDWFIERVADTPSESVWYPTEQQLTDARVVTRVSLGGEANRFALLKDRDSLLQALRREPIFVAYDRRFPGTIDKAVEQGWAVQQRGGNDGEIMTAMRGVVAATLPALLRDTDVPGLERFGRLVLTELNAARAVSPQACVQVSEGTLDVTRTLPPAIAAEEVAVVTQLLAAPPARTPAPDARTANQTLNAVLGAMPAPLREVLTGERAYKDRPDLSCDANISFYETLLKQPPATRDLALQAMFRAGH
ncbi:ATP-dependent Clp protease proteolytic subunit [Bordetella sp. LUAb4]|uniref:ATP-dependent Clp protease proteolytic subunit n=1 Tax=Bordetella sp. LUAb4 TaxID=2843195 RepID=UPI001E5CE8FD|nr:ATP-dependent Clp protease proteolytic subunit [Bordetella sp. LUAb4]